MLPQTEYDNVDYELCAGSGTQVCIAALSKALLCQTSVIASYLQMQDHLSSFHQPY
jgi:hypothetical protein